jgi:hypothetical protein
MSEILKYSQVEEKIFTLREQKIILDSDVVDLYGCGNIYQNRKQPLRKFLKQLTNK